MAAIATCLIVVLRSYFYPNEPREGESARKSYSSLDCLACRIVRASEAQLAVRPTARNLDASDARGYAHGSSAFFARVMRNPPCLRDPPGQGRPLPLPPPPGPDEAWQGMGAGVSCRCALCV